MPQARSYSPSRCSIVRGTAARRCSQSREAEERARSIVLSRAAGSTGARPDALRPAPSRHDDAPRPDQCSEAAPSRLCSRSAPVAAPPWRAPSPPPTQHPASGTVRAPRQGPAMAGRTTRPRDNPATGDRDTPGAPATIDVDLNDGDQPEPRSAGSGPVIGAAPLRIGPAGGAFVTRAGRVRHAGRARPSRVWRLITRGDHAGRGASHVGRRGAAAAAGRRNGAAQALGGPPGEGCRIWRTRAAELEVHSSSPVALVRYIRGPSPWRPARRRAGQPP